MFNNVISFYTSTSVSAPRSSPGTDEGANGLVVFHDHRPNVLSRVYVPIAIINSGLREQITTIVQGCVAANSDIVFSILFLIEDEDNDDGLDEVSSIDDYEDMTTIGSRSSSYVSLRNNHSSVGSEEEALSEPEPPVAGLSGDQEQDRPPATREASLKLVTVCNHTTKFRISPLDIQLIHSLVKASDSLLSSTESLWLPLCLSRVDTNRFLHAHISYLSKYCLILLDVDHNNFEKCRQVDRKSVV